MKADTNTAGEVIAALKTLADAYGKRDLQALSACFASDTDVVMYGTGADEKRIGPEQIQAQAKRDWSQSETSAMSIHWTSISAAGPVAWAAVDVVVKARVQGQDMALPLRASFVFERRKEGWLVVHAHFSVPASGQAEGQSF